MFPGGGAQYPDMGRALYESNSEYRAAVDRCLEALGPEIGDDLRRWMLPVAADAEQAHIALQDPGRSVLAVFVASYALAEQWSAWGVEPSAMIGHSLGEYTAACIAGVMSLEDALDLVVLRGNVFSRLPAGGMTAVQLAEPELQRYMTTELDLASVNADDLCVISGRVADLESLEQRLSSDGVEFRRVPIDVAAHSHMLDPFLEEFEAGVRRIRFSTPTIPFVSNVTGTWITDAEATDPVYWTRQLRSTVRFARGLDELFAGPPPVFIEVGPGTTLGSFVRAHHKYQSSISIVASTPHPKDSSDDSTFFRTSFASLWTLGCAIDISRCSPGDESAARRVPLPTYAFEHEQYWIAPGQSPQHQRSGDDPLTRRDDLSQWFSAPTWTEAAIGPPTQPTPRRVLVLSGAGELGERVGDELSQRGLDVVHATAGEAFSRSGPRHFTLDVGRGKGSVLGAVRPAARRRPGAAVDPAHVVARVTAGL